MRNRKRILAELATRDLKGVEILAPGTWGGDVYTTEHIDAMIAAFPTLRGTIDPPGKLGHDRSQALAQVDGFPAIGWVDNIYRSGDKLLADFVRVPAMVGDIIAAGGYDKVSSEIYFDKEIDGTTYPRILRAVSFLGADLPAVKSIRSISDVAKLYHDDDDAVSLRTPDYEADVRQLDWGDDLPMTTIDAVLETSLEDALRAKISSMRRFNIISEAEEDELYTAVESAEMAFKAQAPAGVLGRMVEGKLAAGYYTWRDETNKKEVTMKREDLIKALSLKDDATDEQIAEAVKAAGVTLPTVTVPAPTGAYLSEADGRKLTEQVGELTKELSERNANDAVTAAMRAGKIVPAQKDWALGYARNDPEGFKTYSEGAPVVVAKPIGIDSTHETDPKEPSEAAKSLAETLGVSEESLKRAASGVPTAKLAAAGSK